VLPDATFSNQKSLIGYLLKGLVIDNIGIFVAISIISPTFNMFHGHLVYYVVIWRFFPVLVRFTKKNLATLVVPM
jgi:hypothetical protein